MLDEAEMTMLQKRCNVASVSSLEIIDADNFVSFIN